ncbi:hypothetical protein G9A89_010318 [Geosiphon pyriformis]|nr:hypothetical protein G9A89_010318 [Geosiphon pyriformis]
MAPNKRNRHITSENEESGPSSLQEQRRTRSKRARHTETDEEFESVKAEENENEFLEEDDDNKIIDYNENDLDAAAEWERKRMKKPGTVGATAESGVMESIELVNFMCHKFLKVNFGPKINFIIGHNGSGKSAILTGITVCLGGKANTTNRASNLKALIREGASAGLVNVRLRNGGDDAYRPDVYGDAIQIERRITRDGTNGYKIKSADGKTISSKREELTAILDHMMIQVDNPMNVLSQDTARQFLHSSSPEDKYKFFLKGTQLTQLSEDYVLIRQSIETTQRIMKRKKDVLPDLFKAAKDAEDRYKNMQKARELELSLDSLKNEMAWAQVEEIEEGVGKASSRLEICKKRVSSTREKFQEANIDLRQITEEASEIDAEYLAHDQKAKPLQDRRKDIRRLIQEKKDQLQDIQNEQREINETIIRLRQTVRQHQQRIEEETRKLESANRQKRDEALASIRKTEQQLTETQSQLQESRLELKAEEESILHAQNQKEHLNEKVQATFREMERLQSLVRQLNEQKSDRLRVFGNSMPQIKQAIQQDNRFTQQPIGPLGMFVNLLRPEWARALDTVIGGIMASFSVQNHEDRQILSEILKRFNCRSHIIVGMNDLFDYSEGEPDGKYLTVLRILQFENEQVKRVFINDKKIESTILVECRADADMIMYNQGKGFPRNVSSCYTIDGFKIGHQGGGFSTQAMPIHKGPSRFTKDFDQEICHYQEKWEEAKNVNARCKQELATANAELSRMMTSKEKYRAKIRDLSHQESRLNAQLQHIREELKEDEPANIAALEEAKRGTEHEIEMYVNQYQQIDIQRAQMNEEQQPLRSELEGLHNQILEISQERDALKRRCEEKVALRMESESKKNHWESKLQKEQADLDVVQSEFEHWEAKLAECTNQALAYCPERVQVTSKPDVLDRKIKGIEKRLREREKEQGASLEEIASDMKTKRDAFNHVKGEIVNMESFIKELRISLDLRMKRWSNFRTFIAIRAKLNFQWQLSKRGYTGKLLFDHKDNKLNLRVQIDDQTETATEKDPKSLSGGEKSFSTICLLLALWEAMGCPIRCLDEFDVFMDAVNRRISMRMMIETARESDCIQYILITPQDASSVSPGPDVRVHRLQDPERGQGTLTIRDEDQEE